MRRSQFVACTTRYGSEEALSGSGERRTNSLALCLVYSPPGARPHQTDIPVANMVGAWELHGSEEVQLPHPAHPEESHGGLVYTIKLRGSYLVSGSADKTVRVWNADTQRLIRGPLCGHEGSVICFDFLTTVLARMSLYLGVRTGAYLCGSSPLAMLSRGWKMLMTVPLSALPLIRGCW